MTDPIPIPFVKGEIRDKQKITNINSEVGLDQMQLAPVAIV